MRVFLPGMQNSPGMLPDGDIPAGVGTNQADRIRYQQLNVLPPDPRRLNPNLPEGLARVVLRAMAKDPAARYPNVQAMADEIMAAIAKLEPCADKETFP